MKEITPQELTDRQDEFYELAVKLAFKHLKKISKAEMPAIMAFTTQAMILDNLSQAIGVSYEEGLEMLKQIGPKNEDQGSTETE